MTEASFNNFFNNAHAFGLNVKVPEKTLHQIGKTTTNAAGSVIEPLLSYLEKNENVFSGDVTHELNRLRAASFTTTLILQEADEKTNGPRPTFDATF